MKPSKAFVLILLISMIVTSGCNVSGTPAATPTASLPMPTSTTLPLATTAPTPVIPTGPLSLVDLYRARVRAGDWTESQGLADLLGMYTGKTPAADVLGSYTVEDFEATGLLSLAEQYLSTHPQDPQREEVQKQVNLLVPSGDRLERFSRKHSLSATAHLASRRLSPPSDTGDEATCQRLWEDGFTDPNPVICFEYDEDTVDGTTVRLYYPSWWAASDARRARLEPFFQAASRAVHTYNGYGPHPLRPVTLVVTELAGTDPDTHSRNSDLYALARPGHTLAPSCYVGLFPSLFDLQEGQGQQALAHEMFHCYQYENLTSQVDGPTRAANDWWVEGSAEYFSNVVYPSVNYEHRWLSRLFTEMREDRLTTWSYRSFLFFQYLENRADSGVPGVLNLLRAMPTSGGPEEQLASLSAYPNMNAIFHEFAEAVTDQNVIDSNGSAIPTRIQYAPDDITEATPGNIFSPEPFTIDVHRLIFPPGSDYGLTTEVTGSAGQTTLRPESTPRAWGSIPPQVLAGCSEVRSLAVVTKTGATDENSYEILLRATAQASNGQCACLTGQWLLDNSSYLTHLNALIEQAAPGTIEYTGVEGSLIASFTADGHVHQQIDGLTVQANMTVSGLPTQTMLINMNGTSTAGFSAEEGSLRYSSVESHLTLSTLLNGQELNNATPNDYFSSGPLGTGATYVCSGNSLSLTPVYPRYSNLPPLQFTRQSP